MSRARRITRDKYNEYPSSSAAMDTYNYGKSVYDVYAIRVNNPNNPVVTYGPCDFRVDEMTSKELEKYIQDDVDHDLFYEVVESMRKMHINKNTKKYIKKVNEIIFKARIDIMVEHSKRLRYNVLGISEHIVPSFNPNGIVAALLMYRYLLSKHDFKGWIREHMSSDEFFNPTEEMMTGRAMLAIMQYTNCFNGAKKCFSRYNTLLNKIDIGV